MFQVFFPTLKLFLRRAHGFHDFISYTKGTFAVKDPSWVKHFPVKKLKKLTKKTDGNAANSFMPRKPASCFAEEQIKAKFSIIDSYIHKEREISCQNHVNYILKKNGAPFRTEHGAPDAQNIIHCTEHNTCQKKHEKPKRLGRESTIHAISLPYLKSLENIPPPEARFSV